MLRRDRTKEESMLHVAGLETKALPEICDLYTCTPLSRDLPRIFDLFTFFLAMMRLTGAIGKEPL